jgi:hypothetical protein
MSEEKEKVVVILEYDHYCINPCDPDDCDCVWQVHSFRRRHSNFTHPEELGIENYDPENSEHVELKRELGVGLAFPLSYHEHGLCSWFVQGHGGLRSDCRWDGVRFAGVAVFTGADDDIGAKTKEDREKDCQAAMEDYTKWCNGQCFGYRIVEPCCSCGSTEFADSDMDSCWGFLDVDEMFREIRSNLDGREVLRFEGKAKALASYHAHILTEPQEAIS